MLVNTEEFQERWQREKKITPESHKKIGRVLQRTVNRKCEAYKIGNTYVYVTNNIQFVFCTNLKTKVIIYCWIVAKHWSYSD